MTNGFQIGDRYRHIKKVADNYKAVGEFIRILAVKNERILFAWEGLPTKKFADWSFEIGNYVFLDGVESMKLFNEHFEKIGENNDK